MITEDDERLYKLKPLPEVPWIGAAESQKRRAAYEAGRIDYRKLVPIIENVEPGDIGYAGTRAPTDTLKDPNNG